MTPSARRKSQRGIRLSDAPSRQSNSQPIADARIRSMIVANYTEANLCACREQLCSKPMEQFAEIAPRWLAYLSDPPPTLAAAGSASWPSWMQFTRKYLTLEVDTSLSSQRATPYFRTCDRAARHAGIDSLRQRAGVDLAAFLGLVPGAQNPVHPHPAGDIECKTVRDQWFLQLEGLINTTQ